MQHYRVARRFLYGHLKGMTHTEITTAKFEIGQRVERPVGGAPYEIIEVVPVAVPGEML